MKDELPPCYAIVGNGDYGDRLGLEFTLDNLNECDDVCCDYSIIYIDDNTDLKLESLIPFRKYLVFMESDKKVMEMPRLEHLNVILFQKVGKFYSIYERRKGTFQQTAFSNGQKIVKMTKNDDFEGEVIRVGSSLVPPYTEVITEENGKMTAKGGIETIFLRALMQKEKLNIEWLSPLSFGNYLWGFRYPNGSYEGMGKLLMGNMIDIASMNHMCPYLGAGNRFIMCSYHVDFDGYQMALLRPKANPTWMGIITPFTTLVWGCIGITLIVATLVLGSCHRLSFNKSNDWPLHFLDAVNPLAGRPMCIPGLQAAHLGRRNKTLAFDVFLILYILSCLIINTGYEGNLKSHLTANVDPNPINSLEEFVGERKDEYGDIILLLSDVSDIVKFWIRPSSVRGMSQLPDVKNIRPRDGSSTSNVFAETLNGHAISTLRRLLQYEIRRQLTKKDGTTDIRFVPGYLISHPITMHLTRMNRFEKLLNRRLSQWDEAGLFAWHLHMEIGQVKRLPLDGVEQAEFNTEWAPLPVSRFFILFGVYGFGFILSLVTFFAERMFYWSEMY